MRRKRGLCLLLALGLLLSFRAGGAHAGREEALRIYHEAVQERYRFFSFGDAMLIE